MGMVVKELLPQTMDSLRSLSPAIITVEKVNSSSKNKLDKHEMTVKIKMGAEVRRKI